MISLISSRHEISINNLKLYLVTFHYIKKIYSINLHVVKAVMIFRYVF